jgi:hypothetical protein
MDQLQEILAKIIFILSEPSDMTKEYLEQLQQDIEIEISSSSN